MPHRSHYRRNALATALVMALGLGTSLVAAAQDTGSSASDPRHDEPAEIDRIVVNASPLRKTAEEL
ncbi:MAG: hypothetical protein KA144_14055, partial [Xanthomonadaceae bacterium]|nr:hypothetical protein [Xanthomonadaceae bacterium]